MFTPVIVLYFSGFIGMKNWFEDVNKLHDKAHEKNKDSVWFTKKVLQNYFIVTLFSIINFLCWIITIYLFIK